VNHRCFRERYTRASMYVLLYNHLSVSAVLTAAGRLIRHNDPDRLEARGGFDKRLVATRRGRPAARVGHVAFPSASDEADWIAARVVEAIAGGRRPREIAVLVRTNALAD